jgi:hypothetical protein
MNLPVESYRNYRKTESFSAACPAATRDFQSQSNPLAFSRSFRSKGDADVLEMNFVDA